MLTQLHVHPPFLLHPRLLEMLAHRRRALALRPAVPVARGGPRWPLPQNPLEVGGSCCSGVCDERKTGAGASLANGSCCSGVCGERSLR